MTTPGPALASNEVRRTHEAEEGDMELSRLEIDPAAAAVYRLEVDGPRVATLLGDNREIMRHGTGAVHAAVIEDGDGGQRLSLFGAREFGAAMERLGRPVPGPGATRYGKPATDSNQNGAYVAYLAGDDATRAGYVVHVPDLFGDPDDIAVHGPLTPPDGAADGSFLQGSRDFNSVVYGWRDDRSGDVYVGVSRDGVEFPPAKRLVTDPDIVRGPCTGVHGDYVICLYQTRNPAFAPVDSRTAGGAYYVWSESGDAGDTWSEPVPLFPDAFEAPFATGLSLTRGEDLDRSEIPLAAVAPPWNDSVQLLAWANPQDASDSRVFALTTVLPLKAIDGSDWTEGDNEVGLLAFKPIAVGGDWNYSLTNRSFFRRGALERPYTGRVGRFYKYCALPGTRVRVIAYVDRAPRDTDLEDLVAILVSTNKGDSFDFESTLTASNLGLERDAEVVISNSACCFADGAGDIWQDLLIGDATRPDTILHATLPIGLNAQGLDPTLTW